MTEKGFGNTLHKRSKMETPVHIEFQGMEPEEKLHADIVRHVAQLEKRFGRITACRVALKGPGQPDGRSF